MKYTTIYSKIKNPLDDSQVIEQLIEAYAESSNFYSALTKIFSKEKKRYYNPSARDELHAALFNRWKKELLSITTEQYEKAIKDGLYTRNIFKLISFLKGVPDVKTYEEAHSILHKVYPDKELDEAMDKYRWDSISDMSGWTHICERNINGKKTITPNIEHRLYINTDLMDVHTFSKIFMDKCLEQGMPFYFKIGEFDRRDDNVVIYSDTKLLPHYLGILKSIEEEYPDLVKRCGRPPVLSGVIRNWIGYGSEPLNLSGEESFNGIRAASIEKAIDEELITWYRNHKNATVTIDGKTISLQEYIARLTVKNKITNMLEYRRNNPNNQFIKYTEADINNREFVKRMASLVSSRMPSIFEDYISGKKLSLRIDVPIKGDITTTLYGSDILNEMKKFIKVIKENEPDFAKKIKERIIRTASTNGIDPNKYCFDIANAELLRKADQEVEQAKAKSAQTPKKEKKSQENSPSLQKKANVHNDNSSQGAYTPMTDEEIRKSQRKLQESQSHQENRPKQPQQPDIEIPKYHRPAGTPMYYKPMTDEEINASQKKLAECPLVKVKKK